MKRRTIFPILAAAFSALLTTVTLRGGTITEVDLNPTNTDLYSGFSTNNPTRYLSAFDFGNYASPPANINGVPLTHFGLNVGNNVIAATNYSDANFGGRIVITVGNGTNYTYINQANSSSQGNLAAQVPSTSGMAGLYSGAFFLGHSAPANSWIELEYDGVNGLNIGDSYRLRFYYRYWGNSVGQRLLNLYFNGEGTWQGYSGNPLDEDAGTNGTCHGARYIEYDFTAAQTNVFLLITNLNGNEGPMIYGTSLEDESFAVGNVSGNNSDIASGIDPAKHYVCAFDFGKNSSPPSINGVPFTEFDPGSGNNSYTAADPNFGGQCLLTCGSGNANPVYFAETSNSGQGNLGGQAQSGSGLFSLLTDLIYVNNSAPVGSWLNQEYGGLTIGDSYSLRLYYRYWGNSAGDRLQDVWFGNGPTQEEAFPGSPIDEDAGGAHYIEYNFTASATNVFCYMTNLVANGSMMLYGATIEDTSPNYTYAPFITSEPAQAISSGAFSLAIQAIGTPNLTYQWFVNTASNYNGTATTDGAGCYGSAAPSLTISNPNFDSYYYCVVTNDYGYATSSIVQLTQPLALNSSLLTLYATPSAPSWRDNYTGASGCRFTVGASNVVVSHLGYFCSNSITGLQNNHYVAIFGVGSPPPIIAQVTVPAGATAAYTNEFYWMPLDPPVVLTSNTTYYVAAMPTNGDGDLWGDTFGATFNPYFVGSTTNSLEAPATAYGPGGQWPPSAFAVFGSNTTYCVEGLANLQIGKARVVVQTTNVNIAPGQTISVTGYGTGQTPINYQWWLAGSPPTAVANQTGATLTIANATAADSGTYFLTASNVLGGEQSANVTVQISANPVGLEQGLANTTVYDNYPATFDLVVTGTPPISLEWSSNNVVIPSATTNDLLSPVLSDSYSFYANSAENGNVYGAMASNNVSGTPYTVQSSATLTVLPNLAYPQEILYGPPPTNVFNSNGGTGAANSGQVGGIVTIGSQSVMVTHLGYDVSWFFSSNNVNGQNALQDSHNLSIYSWNGSAATLLGYTTVAAGTPVSNAINEYLWAPLNPPLVLTNGMQYILAAQGFDNGATSIDPWGDTYGVTNLNPYFASAVSAVFGTSPWPAAPTSGKYGGQIYSAPNMAILTNYLAAEIYPAGNSTASAGSSFTLTASVVGQPPLYYPQWFFDGTALAGQTSTTLTLSPVTAANAGSYYVVFSNYEASVTVTSAVTTVAIPPLTVLAAGTPVWNEASNVIVTFSGDVNPSQDPDNYSLDNGASVLAATVVAPNEVALTTTPLSGSYTLTVQGVDDGYGDMVTPSPTNLAVGLYPANLALWVRANAANVTADSSGNVSQWNDLSGNGNNLQDPYGAPFDPVLATNASGDPVVRFEATNDSVLFANDAPSLKITNDMSIVAVISFATFDGGTNGEIVSKTGSGNQNIPAPYDYYVSSTNSGAKLYRGNGSSYGQFTASSAPSTGVPHILVVTETGNTVSHFLDGAAAGTGTLNNNFQETNCADQGQPLYVGNRASALYRLSGDIAELMIAGSPVSAYDVSQLTPYLAREHNISLVNTSRANIVFSTMNGTNLVLTWPADHTGWQLQVQTNSVAVGISTNWVNVAGSTTTNQMIIPLNLTNGAVFYRLLYNP